MANARISVVSLALIAVLMSSLSVAGQDLIPVSDVTGGSGVFVLRGGARSAPKRFVSKAKPKRSKQQGIESVRKMSKQYTTLAKVAPRRERTQAIDPNDDRLKQIARMDRTDASKLFAGVGEYWMDRDDYNQAIDVFRESLTLDPTNKTAPKGLSEALSLKGNELLVKDAFPAARTFFEEALKYNDRNAPAYFGLAEVLTEMNKEDEAIANYEKALTADTALSEIYTPLGALYYQKGEIAKADEYLTKAVAASPNDAQTLYYLGLIRYTQNRNQEAVDVLKKAAALDGTNADTAFNLAEAYMRTNDAKSAVAEYTRATSLRANYFEAWMGLGEAQYGLGNYQAAVDAYTRATRIKNDDFMAYNNLGDAYRQLPTPDYNKAESNYNNAALFLTRQKEYNPEEAAEMYSKASFSIAKQCEINIQRRMPCRWDAAVRSLESADKLSKTGIDAANLGWAYYNAARADIAAGRTAEAKPKLEKAKVNLQRVANGNADFVAAPMLNLGMALTDLGEYASAVDVLNKVVKKEPKWAFAMNELGIAYRKQDKYKEAAASFKMALDKDKNFAQALYNMGEAQYKAGNLSEGRKAMESLRKMGRNDLAAQLDTVTNGGLRQSK